jgi:hypothetical protein
MIRTLKKHFSFSIVSALMMFCLGISGCGGGTELIAIDGSLAPAGTSANDDRSAQVTSRSSRPIDAGTSGVQSVVSFAGTSAEIANPDRGFYGWGGTDFVTSFDSAGLLSAYNAGQRLILAKVQLDNYRSSDLPSSFLSTLSSRFASVRSAGLKVVLWFNYDFGSGGYDASATQIKRHLEQLKPVLAANADVIPFMRAGFIGAWGEWHSSKSGNSCGYNSGSTTCETADANRAIVRDALLANVPSTTQIQFRYPKDMMRWYPSASQQRRAGVHNDCFLAGPSDSGTYSSTDQRTYTKTLSNQTAFGGETCGDAEAPLRMSCNDILTEGPAYHLSWLNSSDWAGFITAWRNGGCYSKVAAFMGYRLQLDSASHATQVNRGGQVAVTVNLRNVGWSRIFSERQLTVTLRHKTTGATLTGAAGNLRDLSPQATASTTLTIGVSIPSGAQTGEYDVYLGAPDVFAATAGNPKFAVRFANADNASQAQGWDGGAGMFKVGSTLNVL